VTAPSQATEGHPVRAAAAPARVAFSYLALFASLYAAQGVVYAYFMNFNIRFMVRAGVPEVIANHIQSLALLPFVFKFLVGPLSDRVNFFGWGHRKPYIILGLIIQGLGLVGLSLVNPGIHRAGFAALAIATVAGLALYDTCCDGMVVDITPADDRARVQAVLMVSRFLAAMICSQCFGSWLHLAQAAPAAGYLEVLWTCAALGLAPLVLAFWQREPERSIEAEAFQWAALGVLIRPRSLALLAFGMLYALVGLGVEQNLPLYYERALQIQPDGVGTLGAIRNIGRALGAVLIPLALPRLGRRAVLIIGVLAISASSAGQAAASGLASAGIWAALFGMANGWDDALFYVLAMEASDPRMAASTYALFMAVTNLSVAGGSLVASVVAAVGRYWPAFLMSGLVALGALPLVPSLSRPALRPESRDAVAV
jgi:MFS transporter, PAT family, beta-lactamase induction signal transducer AmpG